MGVTGSGKSTFISKCCEDLSSIVGDSLSSCKQHELVRSVLLADSIGTDKCESYTFKYGNSTIHLIDTPGFDDTRKSDTDVLRDIAGWLVLAYRHDVRLSGMVYLHSISETRMKGSHRTNLRMFQKLAGLENLGSVVLTTTLWDKTPPEIGKAREAEMISTDDFWGSMIKNGSQFRRFTNDKPSALRIIGLLVDKHKTVVLSLQREMADGNKALDQTDAGKALNLEINKQKEVFEKRLKEQEDEMKDAIKENDMKYAQVVLDAQDKIQKDMERLAENQIKLQVDNEKLLQEKESELQKAREEMEQFRFNLETQGKAHADEVAKLREATREAEEMMQKGSKAFRDNLVQQTAEIVNIMDQTYINLTRDQEERVREIQAGLHAQQLAQSVPPPPYQPPPQEQIYQPVQHPIYPQPNYQPNPKDDSSMAGLGLGLGTGVMLAAGAAPLCTLM